jgi:dTDP-4-dehydrorhamnose 3,5-epimerase-like enzyme
MSNIRGIEVRHLESMKAGMTNFFAPQTSNETMLVQIPGNTLEDLFVHKSQTDQLFVAKGRFVLVTFINKQYQYIPLSEECPTVVTIPPGVLHGAINIDSEPCVVVNAVLRHREAQELDYVARKKPFPYDLQAAQAAWSNFEATKIQHFAST